MTNCREHDTAEYKLRTLQVSPLDNVSDPSPGHAQSPSLEPALLSWPGRMLSEGVQGESRRC